MRTMLALAAAFGLGAVPAQAQSSLRVSLATDVRALMPGNSPDDSTGTVLQHIYEGLVAWRSDGSVAPMLAKEIAVSSDGREYLFTLRPDVRFHNGQKLTAREVVWTWKTFLDPAAKWPCRAQFDGLRGLKIEKVEQVDELAVRFTLAAPAPAFLSTMARADCDSAGIAHPDSVDASGTWTGAIGTGPFKLGEWRRNQFVELVRFAEYAAREEASDGYAGAKAAKVERLRFLIVPDPAAVKAGLMSGGLDLWPSADPKYAKELAQDQRIAVRSAPVSSVNAVVMQTADPVLADPRLRRAINAAIDYAGLAEAISDGYATPNTSPVPSSSLYFGAVEKQGHAYDPALAKKLLAEAGYKGQPIKITSNARFASMHDIAIAVQAMLVAAGIKAEVETVEFGTQLERYFKGQYQLMVFNYTPYLDPMFVFDRFTGDKSKQVDRVWDSPRAVELIARLATAKPDEKQALYDDLHRLFIADSPMIVWSSGTMVSAFAGKVGGYAPWAGRKPRLWNVELSP
jgi:peptide/nickel transport system substrate-binding protein